MLPRPRSRSSGGRVLTPPYDIPGTGLRQGVFMDPQGATFSLTQPPGY